MMIRDQIFKELMSAHELAVVQPEVEESPVVWPEVEVVEVEEVEEVEEVVASSI
jgi:hypothetical protein